jgi:FkbM family methyltransferase
VRLFVDLSDHVIGLNIVRGRYEQDEIGYVRTVLKAGDSAVDAGAHIGFFTMQMAAMVGASGKVYAFEPLDPNADLLEQSIVENGFGDRVVFERAAVGAASGTATLSFPVETLNWAFYLRGRHFTARRQHEGEVPVVALDKVELAAGPVDQDGRGRRGAPGDSRRARLPTEDRWLFPLSCIRRKPNARRASAPTSFWRSRVWLPRAHARTPGHLGAVLERAPADTILSVVFLHAV